MLPSPATLKELRLHLLEELRGLYSESEASAVSRLVLEHVGYPRSLCLSDPDMQAEDEAVLQINKIVGELHSGRPVQYILGYTEFHDLNIIVNESVLIPRPETEELVHHAVSSCTGEGYEKIRIMDLCSGSGAIALAFKYFFPEAEVSGLEWSKEALDQARQNARINELEVKWLHADLLDSKSWPGSEKFQLVISNPPYVRESEKKIMEDRVLNFEPHLALFISDEDPLLFYKAIADFCQDRLMDKGQLWLEINEALGKECCELLEKKGFSSIELLKDIHNKDRFIHARK